jgi:hypothetical protein
VEAIDRISRWLSGIDEDGWNSDDMLRAAVLDRGRVSRHWFAVRRTLTVGESCQPLGAPDTPGDQGRISCSFSVWRYQVQRSVAVGDTVAPHVGGCAAQLERAPGGTPRPAPKQPAVHHPDHQPVRVLRCHLQPGGPSTQHHLVVAVARRSERKLIEAGSDQ